MRNLSSKLRNRIFLALALGGLIPALAGAAPPRRDENIDVCVVLREIDGRITRTLVYRDVPPMSPGDAVSLRGVYFTSAQVALPFDGSAVMAADGMVRLGILIHTSARRATLTGADIVLSGETDTTFSGAFHLKTDGEVYPYALMTLEPEDCAAVVVP